MSRNTSFLILRLYTPATQTINSWGATLAVFWATNLPYQVFCWATVDHRDQLPWMTLALYSRKLSKGLFFQEMSQHFSDSCLTGHCSCEVFWILANQKLYKVWGHGRSTMNLKLKTKSFLSTMNTVFNTYASNKRIIMTCNRLSNDLSHKTF